LACFLALFAALWTGCDSEVETYDGGHEASDTMADDGDVGEAPEDAVGETGTEDGASEGGGPVAEASCHATDGVSVSGTILFDGSVPASAQLWAVWMDELGTPGMPHCILEVTPAAFPAAFRFTDVPRGESWALQGLLDVSGGFPPFPTAEDFAGGYHSGTIDLSGDVDGLVVTLEPYAP
jgi:hypothetical protein